MSAGARLDRIHIMRFVWVIVILIAIGAIMSWTQDKAEEEQKRLRPNPAANPTSWVT
jgi:hypothetical protein